VRPDGVVQETVETYRPHLEANGFRSNAICRAPLFVNGDRDALAQIVVNLLSNAENIPVTGSRARGSASNRSLCTCRSARARPRLGVPKGSEEKSLSSFTGHDSLSSASKDGAGPDAGAQIRAPTRDVVCEPREGGEPVYAAFAAAPTQHESTRMITNQSSLCCS